MKNGKFILTILVIAITGLFAFSVLPLGSVKGTVTPPDGALKVWVISATDTFNTIVSNGSFTLINVKPGTYKIVIEAAPPYKNTTKEAIAIKDGEVTDVGVIKLDQ